jgi:mannitol operon transcriptional antiterminator
MVALTTRQRDLLQILLAANSPLGAAELADEAHLTPRQVTYDLQNIRRWLDQHNATLKIRPGIGVELECLPENRENLADALGSTADFQLVLTTGQRQQIITLILLLAKEPMILYQLQQLLQMSRTTILKDLDAIEVWLSSRRIRLERRPNYGFGVASSEQQRRQTVAALLWGETPFGPSLATMNHKEGLVFSLASDAHLLPAVQQAQQIIQPWDVRRAFSQVAHVEAQLGGRFTDDAVLHLALVLAIQAQRVQDGHVTAVRPAQLDWLQTLPTWQIAAQVAKRLGWKTQNGWPLAEIASVAMYILATPRNERWPGDLDLDEAFSALMDRLIKHIVSAYNLPSLAQDKTLHDGLVIHIVPACFRQRFALWMPALAPSSSLSGKYAFEYNLAHKLAGIVAEHAEVKLPEDEINNIALLLRAAYIRERPNRLQRVIVVCPSGMATAQLLVARLKARFPRLAALEVLSLRELNHKQIETAALIITTAPLPNTVSQRIKVIQVHPLLLPEDIETITQWLA